MPKYAVMVQGGPVALQVEETLTRCGFYRQEVVSAPDEARARQLALAEVQRLLAEMGLDSESPTMAVTGIRRLSWLGGMLKFSSEFIYYPEENEAMVE